MAGFFEQGGGKRPKAARRERNAFERAFSRFLVSKASLEQAFLQMVILLKGDVPAVAALETAAELAKGDLKTALYETADNVRGGMPLAKALRSALPWMGKLFTGLVEVGESNGSLPLMFSYAAGIMARRRKIRNQFVRAMTYPALVVVAGLGVGYYIATVSIPKIISVMGDPEKLPSITKSLVDTSAWLEANGIWLVAAPVLAVCAWTLARRAPGLGMWLDRFSLHFPVFGKVGRYSCNTLFNHTMAMLAKSGLSVVDSLELAGGTLSNGWYRSRVMATRTRVTEGRMFSASIVETGLGALTPLTPALARVGENSGNMDEGLSYAGEYYADALEKRLDLLGKLVEPALIVVVGGMVAYVYIAFFMGMAAMSAGAR